VVKIQDSGRVWMIRGVLFGKDESEEMKQMNSRFPSLACSAVHKRMSDPFNHSMPLIPCIRPYTLPIHAGCTRSTRSRYPIYPTSVPSPALLQRLHPTHPSNNQQDIKPEYTTIASPNSLQSLRIPHRNPQILKPRADPRVLWDSSSACCIMPTLDRRQLRRSYLASWLTSYPLPSGVLLGLLLASFRWRLGQGTGTD